MVGGGADSVHARCRPLMPPHLCTLDPASCCSMCPSSPRIVHGQGLYRWHHQKARPLGTGRRPHCRSEHVWHRGVRTGRAHGVLPPRVLLRLDADCASPRRDVAAAKRGGSNVLSGASPRARVSVIPRAYSCLCCGADFGVNHRLRAVKREARRSLQGDLSCARVNCTSTWRDTMCERV